MAANSSYGTLSQDERRQNGRADAADQEQAPLLGNGKSGDGKGGFGRRLQKHMTRNVSKQWSDLALLACYPITGLLDSSSVFIWGSFLSMQTGELVEGAESAQLLTVPQETPSTSDWGSSHPPKATAGSARGPPSSRSVWAAPSSPDTTATSEVESDGS